MWSQKGNLTSVSVLAVVLTGGLFIMAASPASAVSVTVGCPGASGVFDYTSLYEALVALHAISHRDHLIIVSGVCAENVEIGGFEMLTIVGTEGAGLVMPSTKAWQHLLYIYRSTGISIRNLKFQGNPLDQNSMVRIAFKSEVEFEDCVFEQAGGEALFVTGQTMVWLDSCVFQGNGAGARFETQSLLMVGQVHGDPEPCVFRDNGSGIVVSYSAHASIFGNTRIEDNDTGIEILGARVNLCCADGLRRLTGNGCAVSADFGTLISHGPVLIQGNRDWAMNMRNTTARLFPGAEILDNQAGVVATFGSVLQFWSVDVSGNGGFGIILSDDSSIQLENSEVTSNSAGIFVGANSSAQVSGSTITDNASAGLRLTALSTGSVWGNVVRDNGSWDLFCSPNSYAQGEKSGFDRVFCPGFDKSPNPKP